MNIISTFCIFLLIFVCIIEFYVILFRLTGVENKKARFQIVSLLTSTGFTTKESELITQHPTRRKIAEWIMVFGYVSSVTFVSFLVNILMKGAISSKDILSILSILIVFLICGKWIDRIEEKLEDIIRKNIFWNKFSKKDVNIISRNKGYGIAEIYIDDKICITGQSIKDSNLKDLELTILNIDKGDKLINFPTADYVLEKNDKLTVYGNLKNIQKVLLCKKVSK